MDERQIHDRVAVLKEEIANLRRADEVYARKTSHNMVEALEHTDRMERVREILDDLISLTKENSCDG